jgi:hypothetical protein
MNVFFLLIDALEDHRISPNILKDALENYLTTLNQYLDSPDIEKQEVDVILGREFESVIKSFKHLLDFSKTIKKQ